MRIIKAAVIGCGSLGRVHADCIDELDGIENYAFCDISMERANAFRDKYNGKLAVADPELIFSNPDIEVVYVTTLHDTHAEFAIRALESGKDVVVEKPLAMSVEDCLRIGDAVAKSGRKLMTAFKMRYYDMLLLAKKLMPEPIMITMQMMDMRWPDELWANDPVKGGGNVISQGCHSCDIIRFMSGRNPIEVYAYGANYYQATGVIDNLTAVFKFEGGATGSWVQGDAHCPSHTSKFFMQMFDENRSITIKDRFTTVIYEEKGKEPVIYKGTETGFLEENRAFVQCMQNDEYPPIDHIDGLYATLMSIQATKSILSGRPEPIQPLLAQWHL